MNSKDYRNIREAYLQVYAPKELTEEQVWEEVEYWVNSLLEEGYDLSDYTWEEMYEQYLSELTYPDGPAIPTSNRSGVPSQQTGMDGRYSPGSSQVRPNPNDFKYKSTSDGKNYKNYNDALAANRSRNAPRPTTPAPSSVTPTPAAPAPGARPAAPAPGARPPAAKTLPTKPMGGDPMDQWARANPTLAAKVKPGQSGYNTIRTRLDADNDRQENYDAYDLVLSHLINEGYADTYEAALTIMTNMSEDWKYSIIEDIAGNQYTPNPIGNAIRTGAGLLNRVVNGTRPKTQPPGPLPPLTGPAGEIRSKPPLVGTVKTQTPGSATQSRGRVDRGNAPRPTIPVGATNIRSL